VFSNELEAVRFFASELDVERINDPTKRDHAQCETDAFAVDVENADVRRRLTRPSMRSRRS